MPSASDAGLFGPRSASWQVNRETTVLFGGARALLMHAAHPLVLAGARQTGFYERNPWRRLERTMALTFAITFGSRAEAAEAIRYINRVHAGVRGVDDVTGLPYDAMDPDLLLWVHACLVDSQLLFERITVGKLDRAGRERFHQEQMLGAERLGLPRSRIPPTVARLRAYIDEMVNGGTVAVTPDARKVADLIRQPPRDVPWRPVLRFVARWAFVTLPKRLRREYGDPPRPVRDLIDRGSLASLHVVRPALPARYRLVLSAQVAERRLAGRPTPRVTARPSRGTGGCPPATA